MIRTQAGSIAVPTRDPFQITGPAVISFSGGRSSAYLLWRVLQAAGGVLPADIVVLFENTGREMPATLDFVRDCGVAWNVPIRWLEYRWKPGGPRSVEVSYQNASRAGEPFEMLISAKSMLPNPVARFCTVELKIRTAARFIKSTFQWKTWQNVIGLRADESVRVERATARGATATDRWTVLCPMAEAGIEEIDVLRFWRSQPFDLHLSGRWQGNCDGCFLKNRGAISRMFVDHPERMQWWIEQESKPQHRKKLGAVFRSDRENYYDIARVSRDQGMLDMDHGSDLTCIEQRCGL